jgi:hypothetical protein
MITHKHHIIPKHIGGTDDPFASPQAAVVADDFPEDPK